MLGRNRKTGKKYAIKRLSKKGIHKNESDLDLLYHELNMMKRVCHRSLMDVFEILEDNDYFYYVCEYIEGGDLDKLVNDLSVNYE